MYTCRHHWNKISWPNFIIMIEITTSMNEYMYWIERRNEKEKRNYLIKNINDGNKIDLIIINVFGTQNSLRTPKYSSF